MKNKEAYSPNAVQAIYQTLASLTDRDPGDPEVQQVLEAWRQHINDHCYPCTLADFRSLGELYAGDPLFIENVEQFGIGLARFINTAIGVYCKRES